MTHALERTSPKGPGQKFIGTCTKCGLTGLTFADMNKECQNPANMTPGEALVLAVTGGATVDERVPVTDSLITALWGIIDDIDTASDVAKDDDAIYRKTVEHLQAKRWATGITTDGYGIFYPAVKVPAS